MAFENVRDQEVAVRLLRNLLARGRIPNGLLFAGPSGVGKSLAAAAFVKAVTCERGPAGPCNACRSCRKAANKNHPDISEVIPLKKARIIDVQTIEEIVELAHLKPFEATYRLFLIHDADRMWTAAQNHLLKTLEEPPGHAVFILLTERPDALLPTIRSRCQRVRFGVLRPETVSELLREQRGMDPAETETCAALSQGQMSRAFELLDTPRREAVLEITVRMTAGEDPLALAEEFSRYITAQRAQIESAAQGQVERPDSGDLSKQDQERFKQEQQAVIDALVRRDILEHLYLFETWYRDVLVYGATGDLSHILNRDQVDALRATTAQGAQEKLAAVEKARTYLERFINEERVFRDLFFALAA